MSPKKPLNLNEDINQAFLSTWANMQYMYANTHTEHHKVS